MNINQRFKELIGALGLNSNKLAIKLGTTGATIGKIVNGKNLPSLKILIPLAEEFPKLNLRWLLLGEGGMFKSDELVKTPEYIDKLLASMEESNKALQDNSKLLREKVLLLEKELERYDEELALYKEKK